MGQRVQVILDRIDRQQRRLQFALLPGTEPVANTGAASPFAKFSKGGKSEAKKNKAKEKKSGGKSKQRKLKSR
jgi:ribonuclease R